MTMALPFERLRDAFAQTYSIDRELGRGGMATVYLAQDNRHERLVALKVLHPELAASLGPDRFLREIEVAARLGLTLFRKGTTYGDREPRGGEPVARAELERALVRVASAPRGGEASLRHDRPFRSRMITSRSGRHFARAVRT